MADQPEKPKKRSAWHLSRRRFIAASAAVLGGAALAGRGCFYALPGDQKWSGRVLGEWEAAVLIAAAGALVLDAPGELSTRGGEASEALVLARRVDGFLQGLPGPMLTEIHAMFGLIEHGTALGGHLLRFTRLSPTERLGYLEKLKNLGSKFTLAALGLRDLCLLGWYEDPRRWQKMGYDGPLLDRPRPRKVPGTSNSGKYGRLIASPGAKPRGAR